MSSSAQQRNKLVYFPKNQFSPRFGDHFYSYEIRSPVKKKAESSGVLGCCISDVVFYELTVYKGKQSWTIFRRYSDFEKLYKELLDQDIQLVSSAVLPPKSAYFSFVGPSDSFLGDRKKRLSDDFLDKILVNVSARSSIAHFPSVVEFLEFSEHCEL
jgi:PX domain